MPSWRELCAIKLYLIVSGLLCFPYHIISLHSDSPDRLALSLSLFSSSPTTIAGIASSILLFVAIIATMVCCFMCSCCYLYQRRQQRGRTPYDGKHTHTLTLSPTLTHTLILTQPHTHPPALTHRHTPASVQGLPLKEGGPAGRSVPSHI